MKRLAAWFMGLRGLLVQFRPSLNGDRHLLSFEPPSRDLNVLRRDLAADNAEAFLHSGFRR